MFRLINEIIDDIIWPMVLLVAFWIIFFYNEIYDWGLLEYGVHPRNFKGLSGIIFMPFLHGDFEHLFSNSVPFIVSAAFVFHFYPKMRWKILGLIWLVSGMFIWIQGNPQSVHVGASGLVYGLVAFLLFSGFVKNNKSLMAVSMLLVFLYGSMVWGIFPEYGKLIGKNISWEGHFAGAATGLVLAWVYRKHGPEDDSFFEDEDEDDIDDDPDAYWKVGAGDENDVTIRYTYKPQQKSDN